FFFLMRSTSAHLDFDLDLARRQNDENPAYYVQYAHARIAALLRFAAGRGVAPREAPAGGRYDHEGEVALLRQLAAYPEVVRGAAGRRRGPGGDPGGRIGGARYGAHALWGSGGGAGRLGFVFRGLRQPLRAGARSGRGRGGFSGGASTAVRITRRGSFRTRD